MKPIRPKFTNPPLVERAITVIFERIDLSLGDYGLFWSSIIEAFPRSEAVAPLPSEIERYEGVRPAQQRFELLDAATLPRGFFRNPEKGELVQLQPDRFGFNWIKTGDDDCYPHSEAVLSKFYDLFQKFQTFAAGRGLGPIKPVQCEITNVNLIPVADIGDNFADLRTILKMADYAVPEDFLKMESQILGAKHLMLDDDGAIIGRVHSLGQPSIRLETNDLAYRLDVTARGAPLGEGPQGIELFYEKAVSAVNAVFLASITQSGRHFWGEIDG